MSHTNKFVGLVSLATFNGYLQEGKHYELIEKGRPTEAVVFSLPRTYPQVCRFIKDHYGDPIPRQQSYRLWFEDAPERDDTPVVGFAVNDPNAPGTAAAITVRTFDADDMITEFERIVFCSDGSIGADADIGTKVTP
jgi:hypothetical protein